MAVVVAGGIVDVVEVVLVADVMIDIVLDFFLFYN